MAVAVVTVGQVSVDAPGSVVLVVAEVGQATSATAGVVVVSVAEGTAGQDAMVDEVDPAVDPATAIRFGQFDNWSLVRKGVNPNLVRLRSEIAKILHSHKCNLSLFLTS